MKVLIACEYSGVVREAFRKKGHFAVSCDILPTEQPGEHYQGDIFDILYNDWDLLIAHPPCTFLANSGVSWLYRDMNRWVDLVNGANFFTKLWTAPIAKKCIENPIMHKWAKMFIGNVKQTQLVQPYMFGHLEQKATCLWLHNLPKLKETCNVKKETFSLPSNQRQRLHYLPPSQDRWKERSKTFQGLANAMADQWGGQYDLHDRI